MTATAPVRTLITKPARQRISVNGIIVASQDILREARNHAVEQPAEAWQAAATALVVKELLVQEARRLGVTGEPASDGEGRTETVEEAAIRHLVEREVAVPSASEEECRRYFDRHRSRFCSATLTETAHILIAASPKDAEARQGALAMAQSLCDSLAAEPDAFAELARRHSQCPSAGQGGSLGQIMPGSTVPEFETALARIAPGATSRHPVETRFGYHVVRVERCIAGVELPFEAVQTRIASYLHEASAHRAQAQYIARLVSAADISGIDLAGAADHRVN